MKSKTFLLGVGAPRCGSTWLFKFLKTYSKIDFGFRKEYHVFDSAHIDQYQYFSAKTILQKRTANVTDFEKKYFDELELLISMESNHDNYFEYFSNILSNKDIYITGDITPTYCALTKDILELIKQKFEDRDITIKVIFIMRDPAEKMYSESRLASKFNRIGSKIFAEKISAFEVLKYYYDSGVTRMTTEYSHIVDKLRSVFSEDELYLGLFEKMHTPTEVDRLCHFLDIKPSYDLIGKKVNSAPNATCPTINDEMRKSIILAYAKDYEYCQHLFPKENIGQLWKQY
jgi:hypothetical protein